MAKIPQIELTEENLKSINYDEIIAITIAEAGAMGEPNGIQLVHKDLTVYHLNLGDTKIDIKTLFKKISVLSSFKCFFGNVNGLEAGWKWFYMGYGNYLLIREIYDDKFKKCLEENLPENYAQGDLYNKWHDILKEILK